MRRAWQCLRFLKNRAANPYYCIGDNMAIVTNPSALLPLDVLHCGPSVDERGPIKIWHRLSRRVTTPDSKNPNFAIHTAMVFPIRSRLFAVEMIGLKQGLRVSSLNRTWDGLERNIISISRPQGVNVSAALDAIDSDIDKFIGYDIGECIHYALPFVKDDPNKPICSSYVYHVLRNAGQFFPPGFVPSPYNLQQFPNFKEVRSW